LMAKQHFSLAAISFSRAELWMEAAKCYLKANDPNQAVQCYLMPVN